MKNYEEMAESVMRRSADLIEQNKKKKKKIIRFAAVLLPCFAVVLTVVLLWGNGFFGSEEAPIVSPPSYQKELLQYAPVETLSNENVNNTVISGTPMQDAGNLSSGGGDAPSRDFSLSSIHVIAKAVEKYPGIYKTVYETVYEYDMIRNGTNIRRRQYYLYRMTIVDPLGSKMEGDFLYLSAHGWDLTQCDLILLAMRQKSKNAVLEHDGELVAFETLFSSPSGAYAWANIVPFTNNVVDEQFWIEWGNPDVWYLDLYDDFILKPDSTLEELLADYRTWIEKHPNYKPREVYDFDYENEEINQAFAYLTPFENGVFVPTMSTTAQSGGNYYRYINGCPTNERIIIRIERDEVFWSKYRFEESDIEGLPNIAAYIENLDLDAIAPLHIDTEGLELWHRSATGWYEKTDDGVYSVVRIVWKWLKRDADGGVSGHYYDETFIILDEDGDWLISREELTELLGYQVGLPWNYEYGKEAGF